MSKNVVSLPKLAFFSSEPIEILVESSSPSPVSVFLAPIGMSTKTPKWSLIETTNSGSTIKYSKNLEPGFYAIGIPIDEIITPCIIFTISSSPAEVLRTNALFFTAGLASVIILIKSTLFDDSFH